jgi:Flp pilus assembly pilin Flp
MTYGFTQSGAGRWGWTTSHPAVELGHLKVRMPMTEMFVHGYLAVRGINQALTARVGIERGASMVEYALLVGLIAIVAVVTIQLLGVSISNLFNSANTCVSNASSCS